jgi:ubiquinol oxidase
MRELGSFFETVAVSSKLRANRSVQELARVDELVISDEAVSQREKKRDRETGYLTRAPWLSRQTYLVSCRVIEAVFRNRPIARFWFLEMIARVPYFSYLSVLHLYESLDLVHVTELRRDHFLEEWNEMHHLLIMQSLGGDARWFDRFLAYHVSMIYYWALVALYLFAPAVSYNFGELLEKHAFDTYAVFVDENEKLLRSLPAPAIAQQYYQHGERFYFRPDTSAEADPRKSHAVIETLYDVFANIRDDEGEHVKMMEYCQSDIVRKRLRATERSAKPEQERKRAQKKPSEELSSMLPCSNQIRSPEDRCRWSRWSAMADEWRRKQAARRLAGTSATTWTRPPT